MEWIRLNCPRQPTTEVELVAENTVILTQDLWQKFTFTIPVDLP